MGSRYGENVSEQGRMHARGLLGAADASSRRCARNADAVNLQRLFCTALERAPQCDGNAVYHFAARGFGGRHALNLSPRQLKEVIQVAHTNVGSVAPLGV